MGSRGILEKDLNKIKTFGLKLLKILIFENFVLDNCEYLLKLSVV